MNHKKLILLAALLPIANGLNACQGESQNDVSAKQTAEAAAAKPTPAVAASGTTSPGKPSAPIRMSYEILGNPVVGSPVAIEIDVSATGDQGPVLVEYSIADSSALVFQQGQVERLEFDKTSSDNMQIAVIPQREGRLYVNVSAEVQTAGGTMIKSMAIPIQVGSAPEEQQNNGELVEGPDGETVISMPAKEND
jgi:hypothetical protein